MVANPAPTVSIDTYYLVGSTTPALVDYVHDVPLASIVTTTPNYDTFNTFTISSTNYRYEDRPINYVGPIVFPFDLNYLPAGA